MDFQIEFWRQNTDVVKFLLEHSEGIELNARNNDGATAFMDACMEGHKDVVQLLLEHPEGIELNAKNDDGETALMIAYQSGHQDIVQLIQSKLELNLDF